jgi:hypothetical protein
MTQSNLAKDHHACPICDQLNADMFPHKRSRREHPQKHIKVGRREACVDEGIAPLIEELWKADIDTCLSCQENRPGIIWIDFITPYDAGQFLSIVAHEHDPDPASLYNRICQEWVPPDGALPDWDYATRPTDLNVEQTFDEDGYVVEIPLGKPKIVFSCSVRFPQQDYAMALERMKQHNARKSASKARPKSRRASAA